MPTFRYEPRDLLELGKIALLLRRQKDEAIEKRNHVFRYCGEIIDFVIPDTVLPLPQRSAFQMPLEQSQYDLVALRHIETQRHFPRHRVIVALTKRHVETAFTIREASQVMADPLRDSPNVQHSVTESLSCLL